MITWSLTMLAVWFNRCFSLCLSISWYFWHAPHHNYLLDPSSLSKLSKMAIGHPRTRWSFLAGKIIFIYLYTWWILQPWLSKVPSCAKRHDSMVALHLLSDLVAAVLASTANRPPPSMVGGWSLASGQQDPVKVIPSGNLLHSYWTWPFIVDLSIENGGFPYLC